MLMVIYAEFTQDSMEKWCKARARRAVCIYCVVTRCSEYIHHFYYIFMILLVFILILLFWYTFWYMLFLNDFKFCEFKKRYYKSEALSE